MSHTHQIVPVLSPEGLELLTEIRGDGNLILLLGSAISSWTPGGLPTGGAINWAIAQKLGTGTVAPEGTVRDLVYNTAFEHVMECAPDEERVRGIFASAFHPVVPNPVHGAVVELVATGVAAHVVTTNYDTGLEAAGPGPDVLLPVIRETDPRRDAHPLLFKIHGCASLPESMVFALRHEGLMPTWKRDLLFSLARGRTLLVMGYSGMDFEICPELPQAGAARVLWLHFDPKRRPDAPDALDGMTANARRVLEATGGTILWGNLLDVLKALAGTRPMAEWSDTDPAFINALFSAFSDEELDAWRMRLYNGIGCALDAYEVANRLVAVTRDPGRRLDALLDRARSLFHTGKYRQAVREYGELVHLLEQRSDRARLPGALHGLAESNRVGGWYAEAHAAIHKLERLGQSTPDAGEQERIAVEVAFLRMLLLTNYYQVARKGRLRPLEKRLRNRALALLRFSVPYAVEHGDWPALQQAEHWADRLGIPWGTVYAGTRLPLPSQHGYRQLGYHLAAMMALRDQLRKGTIGPGDIREPEKLIRTAAEIGDYPEVWKFAAAYQRAGGSLTDDVVEMARHARRQCDEGLLRRVATRLGMG